MKRKIISIIVLAALMFGIIPPAWAQGESAKLSQEEAIKIARDAFGIPENLKNVQISYREEEYYISRKVWEFSWDLSRYGKYELIRAEVDADTGEIISYWNEKQWDPQKKPAKYKSEAECKKIAEALVQKIAPQKFREVKEKKNPYPDYLYWDGPKRYNFIYERQVNGIPFPENSINISVDAETGKIAHYYSSWDSSITFPPADKTISLEQAEKIFREQIRLQLAYMRPYGPYFPNPVANRKPVKLYYIAGEFPGAPGMIDAETGKLIDQYGKEATVRERVYLPAKDEPASPAKDARVLTMEEAKAKVSSYIKIPGDYEVRSSRYAEGWGPNRQKIWEFQYERKGSFGGDSFNVSIDAVTGELAGYNRWSGPWEEQLDKEIKYDYEKCKQIAVDFLRKAAPGKSDYVYLFENGQPVKYYVNGKPYNPPTYNFGFTRVVNGIPFGMNSISIEVNNNTGEVVGFWSNWEQGLNFDSPDSVISEKEALDNLLAAEKPRLTYLRKQNEDGTPSKEIILVYMVGQEVANIVDAKTGKVTNYYELENPINFDDIQGHWAEREIRALGSWGIVSGANNKFNPDKKITRAEFATILAAAKGLEADDKDAQRFTDVPKSAWYYNSVQAAAKAGLVKGSGGKFNPDRAISRQEMVVMLINALNGGQEPSGELSGRFKDEGQIAPWAENFMVQAVEMGVVAGQNGYLKPRDYATRAEAVVMLMRAIEVMERQGGFSIGTSRVIYG